MNNCLHLMMESADIETLPLASLPAPAWGLQPVAYRREIASMSDLPDPPPALPRPAAPKRFRASDVAEHLDMGVIGDICVGVTLAGYRSVVGGFLADEGGSLHALLSALAAADGPALAARAHAVKGAAASMGLRAVQSQAALLESAGDSLSPAQCQAAAAKLQERVDTVRALLLRMGFL